jgi:hypothetical protein
MPSFTAPQCRHLKVNGSQCGSPALRDSMFCFYHRHRPVYAECYSDIQYATGEIILPSFEDAHSIQYVLRQTVQMLLQKRIEKKTATTILYAMQIASSNLKRVGQEKPQPDQVVIDVVKEKEDFVNLIAAPPQVTKEVTEETKEEIKEETKEEIKEEENQATGTQSSAAAQPDTERRSAIHRSDDLNRKEEGDVEDNDLPLGTIQACYRPPRSPRKQREREWIQ